MYSVEYEDLEEKQVASLTLDGTNETMFNHGRIDIYGRECKLQASSGSPTQKKSDWNQGARRQEERGAVVGLDKEAGGVRQGRRAIGPLVLLRAKV